MIKPLLSILLILAAVSIAGCADTKMEPIVETINVLYDTIQPYELMGEKGACFNIEIRTDGSPIDILLLDTENYNIYGNAFENDILHSWKGVAYRDIVSKKFSFTLPKSGTYYMVIENSRFIKNGADAKRNVNVAVRIE